MKKSKALNPTHPPLCALCKLSSLFCISLSLSLSLISSSLVSPSPHSICKNPNWNPLKYTHLYCNASITKVYAMLKSICADSKKPFVFLTCNLAIRHSNIANIHIRLYKQNVQSMWRYKFCFRSLLHNSTNNKIH